MNMEFIPTQLATAENGFGYSDYEMVIFNTPELIVELVLTIPFDERESPYLRLILGNQEERFDMETPAISITQEQATQLLNGEHHGME